MRNVSARWKRIAVAGLAVSLLLCVGASSGVMAQDVTSVNVQAFVYDSAEITVPVGATITWTNNDPVAHTVTDIYQMWDSGLFDQGVTYSKTFDTPGEYAYYCIPHPMMIGKVIVTN